MSRHNGRSTGVADILGFPPASAATQPGAAAGAARATHTMTIAARKETQAINQRWGCREEHLQQHAVEQHERSRGDDSSSTCRIGQNMAPPYATDAATVQEPMMPVSRGKGRGTFKPSAHVATQLPAETVRAVQSSAGAFTAVADSRADRSRRKVSDWDVSGVKGRQLPPSAANDIYRTASPLNHDDPANNFIAPVRPKHPIAVAQAESAGGRQVQLLDAFGRPAASPRRSLTTLAAAQKQQLHDKEARASDLQTAGRTGDTDDENEPGVDETEDHRMFASSLRGSSCSAVQKQAGALTFHEALYAAEDRRSQSMAAMHRMAAARRDRHWDDAMSDISGSLSDLESLFEIDGAIGDPAATIAQAKAEAMQAEAELIASWQKKPSPRSSALAAPHQRHDAAGAPAALRHQTPRPRSQRLLTDTPAARGIPEQSEPLDLEEMRADVARLATAADRAKENAKRCLAPSKRSSPKVRNEEAGHKLRDHNWSFAEMGRAELGGGDARYDLFDMRVLLCLFNSTERVLWRACGQGGGNVVTAGDDALG